MQIRLFATVVIALVGCGCATANSGPIAVDYQFLDRPDESRIELAYRNETGMTLCLSNDAWPSKRGKLDQMDDRVFLIVGAERFPIAYFEEYCPSGCVTRVQPDEEIAASIPYAEFSLPERLRYEPKTLEFESRAYVCR
ncbi:MAG: hypothetical protein AB7F91_02485 [Parvularculaceae bacterium]